MPEESEPSFEKSFNEAFRNRSAEMGRFNLAVFGKTGVGKSSLINAIFGSNVAETGIGKPVTQEDSFYIHESGTLGILDTKGLEIGTDNVEMVKKLTRFVHRMRKKPLAEQIHVVWYCVRSTDRRFEESEVDFIQAVHDLGLPVIIILTQVARKGGATHPDSLQISEEIARLRLPVHAGRPLLTMAHADKFNELEGHGVLELLDATFHVAPEGVTAALNAAQKVDVDRKWREARAVVGTATAASAAAGAIPIPFADATVLIPIQGGMMSAIALIFDIPMDRASAAALAATSAATQGGKFLVTNLLKMVPGFGQSAALVISSTVAAGITGAMGFAWITVCDRLSSGDMRGVDAMLDSKMLQELFMAELKHEIRKRIPGSKAPRKDR